MYQEQQKGGCRGFGWQLLSARHPMENKFTRKLHTMLQLLTPALTVPYVVYAPLFIVVVYVHNDAVIRLHFSVEDTYCCS